MCSRKDRIEVYPLFAVEHLTIMQTRKESRHHYTRFPRSTRSKHYSQQAGLSAFFILTSQSGFYRCRQFVNEGISSKKIAAVKLSKGMESFVGVAWDWREHDKLRPCCLQHIGRDDKRRLRGGLLAGSNDHPNDAF